MSFSAKSNGHSEPSHSDLHANSYAPPLDHEDKLQFILDTPSIAEWCTPEVLETLTFFRKIPQQWAFIKARYREHGGNAFDLEKAVDAQLRLATLAEEPAPARQAPSAQPLAPPLPKKVLLHPELADGAAPWLDAYIEHSTKWSPRAAAGFHAAIGLWMLSTIAARRIAVELGSPLYPSLFMALVSRSTLYAKTTTARIGTRGMWQAGCGNLLASSRSTPQALLRSMAGVVPQDYASLNAEAQIAATERIAFAAQRGWYYEEWGGMLHQMTRQDSPISEFHGLLRWMDDGDERFESDTISRGIERVHNPYLALLCSATPHDLAQFMRPGAKWWHDGFWPRFSLITPMADALPSRRRQPEGMASLPSYLLKPLQEWHKSLGIPKACIEEILQNEKPTGTYKAAVDPLPCRIMTLGAGVLDAYYTYNDALLDMVIEGAVPQDLDSCYGRFHVKALRIAMLLASLQEEHVVALKHWTYAQDIAEQWRLMLHHLVEIASGDMPRTREELLEDKLEAMLSRHGEMTARDLHRIVKGFSSREIDTTLQSLHKAERIVMSKRGKAHTYGLPSVSTSDGAVTEETKCPEDDIPPF